jgi:pimeloyl-ACP methyl ester carboxylesterase/DNA-binding CsgD family transcriptional regulator
VRAKPDSPPDREGPADVPELKQSIRFCRADDGVRLAYSTMGKGPPLVRAAHYLTHLEFDLRNILVRPWLAELSRHRTLVRYDPRGCGLSDRETGDLSFDRWVADLETVVDAAGLERFALLGASQSGGFAVAYAARHPERVERLIVYGGYLRGQTRRNPTPEQVRQWQMMLGLVELGWGQENPAFRQMMTSFLIPGGTAEQMQALNDLARACTTGECAARILASVHEYDASEYAPRVKCPTLVVHARGDVRCPLEEGRRLAALVPGARFVTLETNNHILLEQEPAFARFFGEIHEFLAAGEVPHRRDAAFPDLTPREREILELVAHGLDNETIAARLGLSEKTVRNHITPIFDKLGVPTRAQAIVRAREAGFAGEPLAASR